MPGMSCSKKSVQRYVTTLLDRPSSYFVIPTIKHDYNFRLTDYQNLKNLPPLNRYVAFCRLGIRWPHNGELLSIVPGQHDKYCEEIIKFYETWPDDPKAANKHFCRRDPVAKKIFSSEIWTRILTTVPGATAHNHKIRCEQWFAREERKHYIMIPKELIDISKNRIKPGNITAEEQANGTFKSTVLGPKAVPTTVAMPKSTVRGNGVFHTFTLDQGLVPTTVVVEESAEKITIDVD